MRSYNEIVALRAARLTELEALTVKELEVKYAKTLAFIEEFLLEDTSVGVRNFTISPGSYTPEDAPLIVKVLKSKGFKKVHADWDGTILLYIEVV